MWSIFALERILHTKSKLRIGGVKLLSIHNFEYISVLTCMDLIRSSLLGEEVSENLQCVDTKNDFV